MKHRWVIDFGHGAWGMGSITHHAEHGAVPIGVNLSLKPLVSLAFT
ncbi:MAG: hypothetical protein QQW96_20500 [Tychonema bourrellyi B0820]|nr:hypothetical protein [Tychonema bourrellyi B0820]